MVNGRRSKAPDVRCKKHPKHKQSPGVCAVCLSEKLSRLSNNTSSRSIAAASCSSSSSDSLSSYCSSSASSYSSSPMHHRSISAFLISSKNVLTKSRSMALFVPSASASKLRGGEEGSHRGGKKKSGFWKKLLLPRNSKRTNEGLMHSQTVREGVMVH